MRKAGCLGALLAILLATLWAPFYLLACTIKASRQRDQYGN